MAGKKSYETTLKRLEKAVETLENGDLDLEKALKIYKGAVADVDSCRKALETAELEIRRLEKTDSGDFVKEAIDD
ncbi:MAG: exodeoxyribonuclease VII small subunit [Desulfuromonas sp.]|nr:MAG: exodeoxyribonuclease VII small subunit [Desulfuromonas sp.]